MTSGIATFCCCHRCLSGEGWKPCRNLPHSCTEHSLRCNFAPLRTSWHFLFSPRTKGGCKSKDAACCKEGNYGSSLWLGEFGSGCVWLVRKWGSPGRYIIIWCLHASFSTEIRRHNPTLKLPSWSSLLQFLSSTTWLAYCPRADPPPPRPLSTAISSKPHPSCSTNIGEPLRVLPFLIWCPRYCIKSSLISRRYGRRWPWKH